MSDEHEIFKNLWTRSQEASRLKVLFYKIFGKKIVTENNGVKMITYSWKGKTLIAYFQ